MGIGMSGPPIADTRLHDLVAAVAPLITLRTSVDDTGEITAAEPLYADSATAAQRAAGDAVIADYLGDAAKLARAKPVACAKVDAATSAAIGQGFTHSGKRFSLSIFAQASWLGLAVKAAGLSYPYKVTTSDNFEYSIVNASEMNQFLGAAFAAVEAAKVAGRAKKLQIHAATTSAEIETILASL